jgi:cyclic pyranopterin phosphate synthase
LPHLSPDRYNEIMDGPEITHVDASGQARMVDVSHKPPSERWAVARGAVIMSPETLATVRAGDLKKGDVRAVAELAGVMAAKRTSELIPLCHPLQLAHVEVKVELSEEIPGASIMATVRALGPTGVEMEALTAVSVAALTVYDMVKAVEREARITDIRLIEKHGGTSGDVVLEA